MDKIAKNSKTYSKLLKDAGITENDVLIIWDTFSLYIRQELSKKKGVVISGFGTFTFVEIKLDIGNNKHLMKLKPFFLLSDKFAQRHCLEFEKEHHNTAIQINRVNFSAVYDLSKRGYSRDIIETVLNEAFTAIDHFLRTEGQIAIPFNGLGVLRVSNVNPKPKKQAHFEFSSAMANHLPM